MTVRTPLPESQTGPAERLLALVLDGSAHLWHNRPGLDVRGTWQAANGAAPNAGVPVAPGLHAPAAVALYRQLLEIYQLNPDLMAHLASYALIMAPLAYYLAIPMGLGVPGILYAIIAATFVSAGLLLLRFWMLSGRL